MLYRNIFLIYLFFFSSTSNLLPGKLGQAALTQKWIVNENSSLCVNGSTNVNKFSCEILSYRQTDTLSLNKSKTDKEIVLSGNISLNIQSFDCHNSVMTHDLRKTLKEKQFPVLNINFLSLNKLPELTAQPAPITGWVDIEIAGVRKRFEINYQISVNAQKVIYLIGSRDINFSDFDLIPPKKLGGMIQTRDKLSINFQLKMKAID